MTVQDPFTAERWQFQMPGGGLGFTRVPSLVSIWSTAPFLVNNRLGPFSEDPSVDGADEGLRRVDRAAAVAGEARARAGLRRLYRPHDRAQLRRYPEAQHSGRARRTWSAALPAQPFRKVFDKDGNFSLGPIPKGFPINLAANFQSRVDIPFGQRGCRMTLALTQLVFDAARNWPSLDLNGDDAAMLAWASKLGGRCARCSSARTSSSTAATISARTQFNATDDLSDDEKAFGTEPSLSDDDKRALIEYLKTF